MRVYVVKWSATHRDSYVSAGNGVYHKVRCCISAGMRCEAPATLSFADLTNQKAYNHLASREEVLAAEEILEAEERK